MGNQGPRAKERSPRHATPQELFTVGVKSKDSGRPQTDALRQTGVESEGRHSGHSESFLLCHGFHFLTLKPRKKILKALASSPTSPN